MFPVIVRSSLPATGAALVAATVAVVACMAVAVAAHAGEPQPPLPVTALVIEGNPVAAELATSAEQRYVGLGSRPSMPADAGMLFVYPDERMLTFTMRDTLIPLSIAYIDGDFEIREILDMDVGPDQLFPATEPARYALEMNQGWFERHGVEVGDVVEPGDGLR